MLRMIISMYDANAEAAVVLIDEDALNPRSDFAQQQPR